jgi:hypothetical protein
MKMVKKVGILMMAVMMAAVMSVAAFAAEKANGKVSGVSGDKVTVVLEGAVPAWVKAGATVKAGASGAPKIVSVKGNEVVLRFSSKAKAEKIKVDSAMPLEESAGEELQGC